MQHSKQKWTSVLKKAETRKKAKELKIITKLKVKELKISTRLKEAQELKQEQRLKSQKRIEYLNRTRELNKTEKIENVKEIIKADKLTIVEEVMKANKLKIIKELTEIRQMRRRSLYYVVDGKIFREHSPIDDLGIVAIDHLYHSYLHQITIPDLAELILAYLPPFPARSCHLRVQTKHLNHKQTRINCEMVISYPNHRAIEHAAHQMFCQIISSVLPGQFDKDSSELQIQNQIRTYLKEYREHSDMDKKRARVTLLSSSSIMNYGVPLCISSRTKGVAPRAEGLSPYMMVCHVMPAKIPKTVSYIDWHNAAVNTHEVDVDDDSDSSCGDDLP